MNYISYLKFLVPLFILIGISYFLWHGLSINPRLVPSALINEKTPEFNLQSLIEPKVRLTNKIFLGHVSLLNVWATWCVTCADEYPVLMDIAKTNKVQIYGMDYKDNRAAALNWIRQYGNPFIAIGFDKSGTTAINWGVYGTPETFIIDKKGVIRYKQIGGITHAIWKQKLQPLVTKFNNEQ